MKPTRYVTDIVLALLSSLMTVLGSLAFAAMVFSGPLAFAAPVGFLTVLSGTCVAGLIVGLLSRFPCNISGAQDQAAGIIAIFAASVAATGSFSAQTALSTVVAMIATCTLLFGLTMLAMGMLRLGKLAQMIPYPVVAGYLAGVGVLVLLVTVQFLSGLKVSPSNLGALTGTPSVALRWLLPFAVALLVFAGMKRISGMLFLPGMLALVLVAFHAVAWALAMPLERLRAEGWLFDAVSVGGAADIIAMLGPSHVDVSAIAGAPIAGLVLVCVLGASLATTALEVGAGQELDPNHELKVHGAANVAAAFVIGLPAFTLTGPTLAYQRMGATSRLMPVLRAVFSLLLGLVGISALGFVPKMMVGVILFLFAIGLVVEWLVPLRNRLPLSDYALIAVIVATIVFVGFLEGIGAGIVLAAVLFLVRYSELSVIKAELSGKNHRSDVDRSYRANELLGLLGDRLLVFELQGYIFFGSATRLLDRIRQRMQVDGRKIEDVVLGFQHIDGLDSSANFALRKLRMFSDSQGIRLKYCNLTSRQRDQLVAAGAMNQDGADYFQSTAAATESVENRLLQQHGYWESEMSPDRLLEEMLGDRAAAAALLPHLETRELAQGEVVFRQGDSGDDVIMIISGFLIAVLDLPNGKHIRLRKFAPGSVVGEMSYYTGLARSTTIVADSPVCMWLLRGSHLRAMRDSDPRAATRLHEMIARHMAQRIRAMNTAIQTLTA